MNRLLASLIELRGHRGRGAVLIRNGIDFLLLILAPDPGGSPASEASVAIPKEPVLVKLGFGLVICHESCPRS
jgi:hypothetical protein